jgi:hypothetical protein
MSLQASVHSIDALKDLRVALALYGDDTLGALGAVDAEVRRTLRWLHEERPYYWQDQIKRRREQVALARSEVFRRNLQKKGDYSPPMSEQKENLRKAESSLQEAEKRLAMVRKWQPLLSHAVLEYHASVQRLKDLAAGDVPRAVNLLSRMIGALEAYLRVVAPSGLGLQSDAAAIAAVSMASSPLESIATKLLDDDEADVRALREASRQDEAPIVPEPPATTGAGETATTGRGAEETALPPA